MWSPGAVALRSQLPGCDTVVGDGSAVVTPGPAGAKDSMPFWPNTELWVSKLRVPWQSDFSLCPSLLLSAARDRLLTPGPLSQVGMAHHAVRFGSHEPASAGTTGWQGLWLPGICRMCFKEQRMQLQR